MESESSKIGYRQAGAVNRRIMQNHPNRPNNEETDENGHKHCCDYDENYKGGFGIDVGSHLWRQK